MTPLGQAAGRKNLAKFLGIDMRAGSTGGLMMVMVVMMVVMMVMMVVMMVMMVVMIVMMVVVREAAVAFSLRFFSPLKSSLSELVILLYREKPSTFYCC